MILKPFEFTFIFVVVMIGFSTCTITTPRYNHTFVNTGYNDDQKYAVDFPSNFTDGGFPKPRYYPYCAYHENYTYIYGGKDDNYNLLADFWKFDVVERIWYYIETSVLQREGDMNVRKHLPTLPGAGFAGISLVYDDSFYVIAGERFGFINEEKSNDIFRFVFKDENKWEKVIVNEKHGDSLQPSFESPKRPGGRSFTCGGLFNDKMLVMYGGNGYYGDYAFNGFLNGVWTLDLENPTKYGWIDTFIPDEVDDDQGDGEIRPPSRSKHSCWIDKNELYIYGGENNIYWLWDLWKFHIDAREWTYLQVGDGDIRMEYPDAYPGQLFGAAAAYFEDDRSAYLIGGHLPTYSKIWSGKVWKYDLKTETFSLIEVQPDTAQSSFGEDLTSFSAREYPAIIPIGSIGNKTSKIMIFGGFGYGGDDSYGALGDVWFIESLEFFEAPICYAYNNSEFDVCNHEHTHQECIGYGDVCGCEARYFGENCTQNYEDVLPVCNGVLNTSKSYVCNGNGECTDDDYCTCFEGYYGENCDVWYCFGFLSNSSDACNENGFCQEISQCFCEPGYVGYDCSIYSCFGVRWNDTENVCNGNGNCSRMDVCECNDYRYGPECDIFRRFNFTFINTNVDGDQLQKDKGQWVSDYVTIGGLYPAPRISPYHTVSTDQRFIFMFGGRKAYSEYLGEFWKFDVSDKKWMLLETDSSTQRVSNTKRSSEPGNVYPGAGYYGESLYYNNSFYMIGGFRYGYTDDYGRNDIFKYYTLNGKWEYVTVEGDYEEDNYYIKVHDPKIPGGFEAGCGVFVEETSAYIIYGGWGRTVGGTVGELSLVWGLYLRTHNEELLRKPRWDILSTSLPYGYYESVRYEGVYDLSDPTKMHPAARYGHTCWLWDNHYYMHGGYVGGELADTWKLNFDTNEWRYIDTRHDKSSMDAPFYFLERTTYPDLHPSDYAYQSSVLFTNNERKHPHVYIFYGKHYSSYASDSNIWKFDLLNEKFSLIDKSKESKTYGSPPDSTFLPYDEVQAPSYRYSFLLEKVGNDSLFIFGGKGEGWNPYGGTYDYLGDLWTIDRASNPDFFNFPFCNSQRNNSCPKNRGVCAFPGICECPKFYYGEDCKNRTFECFGISSNITSRVCGGAGKCVGTDTCVCDEDDEFVYGSKCSITPQFNFTYISTSNNAKMQQETYAYDPNELTSVPNRRRNSFSFYHDKHLYMYGGYGDYFVQLGDLWKFSVEDESWHSLYNSSRIDCKRASLRDPVPGCGCCGNSAFYNDSFYIVAGQRYMYDRTNPQLRNDIFRFHEPTSSWSEVIIQEDWTEDKDNFDYPFLGSDPYRIGARYYSCSIMKSSIVYIVGGYGAKYGGAYHYQNDVWSLDLAHIERGWVVEFVDVVDYPFTADPGRYDPYPPTRPSGRCMQACWNSDEERYLYMHGGVYDDDVLSDLWKFDLVLKKWIFVETRDDKSTEDVKEATKRIEYPNPYPGMLFAHGAVSLGDGSNTAYLFFGSSAINWRYDFVGSIWKFDMNNDRFSLIDIGEDYQPNMMMSMTVGKPSARFSFVAFKGEGRSIYIFGGVGKGRVSPMGLLGDMWLLNSTEFFDAPFCPMNGSKMCFPEYDSDRVICGGYGRCECPLFFNSSDGCRNRTIVDCFGISKDDENVCNSNGNSCTAQDECLCSYGYYGKECEISTCYGELSNDTDVVCSGHGNCMSDGTCSCWHRYIGSENCSEFECFGVLNVFTNEVCSGKGRCVDLDICHCDEDNYYYGEKCDITICNNKTNILSNETDRICSGHGTCEMNQTCTCDLYYWGDDCNEFNCFDFYKNDSEVCREHGECIDHDFCVCDGNYSNYLGVPGGDCDSWACYGIEKRSDGVCNFHGDCKHSDFCNCTDPNYFGVGCQNFYCFDTPNTEIDQVCGRHGSCKFHDVCFCDQGYGSSVLNGVCDEWFCGEKYLSDPEVCHTRGRCISSHECSCRDGYEGLTCETWACGYDYKLDNTCSGHGKCTEPDICDCNRGYDGEKCENNLIIGAVLGPTLSLAGVSVFLFIGFIVCCFCSVMICFCTLTFIGAIIVGIVITTLRIRNKKFSKLKNFDILMAEQEMEEDESIAHLTMTKSLFKVEFDEIKISKILGEGGSNSTVFKAVWKGRNVAFKCFKTRLICSSQDNFNEFEREVEVFSSISHPSIVAFYGCSLKPPRVGILMEYCSKGECYEYISKYELINNKKYPFSERMRMLSEIISGMEFLHSRSIIHRDLKCENVLLDERENCKIMDFGLSKISENLSQQKTKKVGTGVYMAPEVASGSTTYNEKCDVFSFSILVFVILSNDDRPYGTAQHLCLENRVANDPLYRPDLSRLDAEIPTDHLEWIKEVLKKCWSETPHRRLSFQKLGVLFSGDEKNFKDLEEGKGEIAGKDNDNNQNNDRNDEYIRKLERENEELRRSEAESKKEIRRLREEMDRLKRKSDSEDDFDDF